MIPRTKLSMCWAISLLCTVLAADGESLTAEERQLEQIKNDLKTRREARESALAKAGVVCSPEARTVEWYAQRHTFKIEDEQLASCAQLYATLTQEEVMVSGRVAKLRLRVSIQNQTVPEAIAAIRRAVSSCNVSVQEVGARIVIWIPSESKEPL